MGNGGRGFAHGIYGAHGKGLRLLRCGVDLGDNPLNLVIKTSALPVAPSLLPIYGRTPSLGPSACAGQGDC
jgi:hypothetical protein